MFEDNPTCPFCGSDESRPLGWLGMLEWFRCRSCGMDFHTDRSPNGD